MGNKITKETIPQGFSLQLALVDFIPVIFFGVNAIIFGVIIKSPLVIAGAAIACISGVIKCLWKIIAALKQKNVWWMFLQMRIVMPIGMMVVILAAIFNSDKSVYPQMWQGILSFPECIFFGVGVFSFVLMTIFAFALDSKNVRSNWIEQITNSVGQIGFFVGLMLLL